MALPFQHECNNILNHKTIPRKQAQTRGASCCGLKLAFPCAGSLAFRGFFPRTALLSWSTLQKLLHFHDRLYRFIDKLQKEKAEDMRAWCSLGHSLSSRVCGCSLGHRVDVKLGSHLSWESHSEAIIIHQHLFHLQREEEQKWEVLVFRLFCVHWFTDENHGRFHRLFGCFKGFGGITNWLSQIGFKRNRMMQCVKNSVLLFG